MNMEREIFGERDPEAQAARDARADADIAAGRYVEHEKVSAWLKTWGKPDEKPMPPEWLA
ncbi:MAG: antitoxin [Pseudomonadota bacterium]